MRAVLFEGTPEEFAKVEAMFRAGGDPSLQTRSIVLPQSRPKAWPELGEEHCYHLAKRVLERAPASLVEALGALAQAQNLHGEQTIGAWAGDANRHPDGLLRFQSRHVHQSVTAGRGQERDHDRSRQLLDQIPR